MKFVLFLVESSFKDAIYKDVYENRNVILYKKMQNTVLDTIRNIHTSVKLNKYFRLPFQNIWKHTFFDERKIQKDETCIFLFEEGNKQAYNLQYLKYIRNKYTEAKLFFLFWNPARTLSKKYIDFVNENFDNAISFDPQDCREHNWLHYSGIYSRPRDLNINNNPEYDILFIGNDKGRLNKIRTLYDCMTRENLKCDFYVSDVKSEECKMDGIHYNEYLDYQDVIKHVQNSRAILEILQNSQHGSTLRTMEALVYKKLLFTNNVDVKNERYYNEKQMYIIDDMVNPDIQKIYDKCKSSERFEYKGSVSPTLFLDFLMTL